MKRHRSLDTIGEGSSRAKLPKTSSGTTATAAENEQLPETHPNLYISITLRSATKAARNDPKPPFTQEELLRMIRPALGTDDPSSDSNSSQAVGDKESLRDPDPARDSAAAASPSVADGERSVQLPTPVVPAPATNTRQQSTEGSLDRSNEDDNYGLEDDHSHTSDDYEESQDSEELEDSGDGDSESVESYDDGLPWYEEIDGRATFKYPTDIPTVAREAERDIGYCDAKLIRRNMMRESFWLEMEMPTHETHDLAFKLFDRYGRLNLDLYKHDVIKGTGVWGNELDHGDLLLFEELRVDETCRRRGIGRKVVNAILDITRKKVSEQVGFFALARPGFLDNSTTIEQVRKDAIKVALDFWHAMGFRRVGTSSWLAWTDSPGHPARLLGIAQDSLGANDILPNVPLSGETKQIFQKLADPTFEAAKCIDELTKAFPEDFEDSQWQMADSDGNTLLHIASMAFKPDLVSFLISNISRLTAMRNQGGYTALEALQNQLEHQRTRRSDGHRSWVTSDAFQGFGASSIACLAALENTSVVDLSTLSPRDIEAVWSATNEQIQRAPQLGITRIRKTLRYKYGCTCGQCIGGFLSPRMKFALLCEADSEHDMMHTFMCETGSEWVSTNYDLLTHLPESVRENLKTNKSLRQGFANMCSHFAECLRKGRMPTEKEVLDVYKWHVSEWPPVTKNYFQRGGSVAAVANMIFEKAMEDDEWAGDGGHRECFGEQIDELVVCRNDHEFGFVAGICGYKRVRPVSSRFFDMRGRELDPDTLE